MFFISYLNGFYALNLTSYFYPYFELSICRRSRMS